MLQTMRRLAQSWVFKTLMLLLIISFSIWGIGDIFRGNPLQRTVAKIGNRAISVQVLDRNFDQALTRAHQQFGPELTRQQAKQMGLLDSALNDLIDRAAVEQDVERLGLNVSDKEFLTTLASMTQFHDKDGKFDKEMFRQALDRLNMSERTYIDSAREQMAQQQLFAGVRSSDFVPKTMIDNLYRARGQKRILDVVSIKDDSFGGIADPDDKTLSDYYLQNSARFVAPEYRALTIAKLSTDDTAKDVSVSEEDLKKEFAARADKLSHPERRDLMQVVVQDEARARQLAASAKAANSLAGAAKIAGYTPTSLDQVEEKTLLPELAKSIFDLKTGQVSEPIHSGLGWHVVQVKKIIPAGTPDFESMKDQLRAELLRDKAADDVARLVNQLDDQLAAGHSLEDIADSMKLRLVKIAAVDAEGKTPDGKDPAEFPARDDVLKAAFSQSSGETSPVIDDRQGNYIVVRTDDVTASAVPPLEKIKDRVVQAWKEAEQAKRAAAAAEDIAKGMREGKPASSFAAQRGVDVRVSRPISLLGDSDPDLTGNVLPQILKMKKGDVIVVPQHDRQLVLRLAELVEADPAAPKAEIGKVKSVLDDQVPMELAVEYVKYLRVLFPVEVNEGLLDTLRQQGG